MSFVKFIFSKQFVKQLLLAVLVLIVVVFLVMIWLGYSTNHGQKIEVPDLSKMSLTEAESTLATLELRMEVLDSANFNPDFPKFSVIEQIPTSGSYVKENRKIYLTLNPSGYRKVAVPNIVGKTLRQALPTLHALGFEVGEITEKEHISDQVLAMEHNGIEIIEGTTLEKTAVIDLTVGDGSLNRKRKEIEKDEDNEEENGEDGA